MDEIDDFKSKTIDLKKENNENEVKEEIDTSISGSETTQDLIQQQQEKVTEMDKSNSPPYWMRGNSEKNEQTNEAEEKPENTEDQQATPVHDFGIPPTIPQNQEKAITPEIVPAKIENEFLQTIKNLQIKTESLPVDQINEDVEFPNYLDKTESSMPLVRRMDNILICSDGFDLVVDAKNKGEEYINCVVYDIDKLKYPKSAAMFLKIRDRLVPLAGAGRYSEFVLNIRFLCDEMCAENSKFFLHEHGGSRGGASFINDDENNIRIILTEAFGRTVNVEDDRKVATGISNYIAHGRFLSIDVLKKLAVQKDVTSEFFVALQKPKLEYAQSLQYNNKTETETENEVSEWALGTALSEFRATKKVEHKVLKDHWAALKEVSDSLYKQIIERPTLPAEASAGGAVDEITDQIGTPVDAELEKVYDIIDKVIAILTKLKSEKKPFLDARPDLKSSIILLQDAEFLCMKSAATKDDEVQQ